MKKIGFLTLLAFFLALNCKSTGQQPDTIIYNKQKCILFTDWSFPSLLQQYYILKGVNSPVRHAYPPHMSKSFNTDTSKIIYPFPVISTANYRGHIATWEIVNDSLFLSKVEIPKRLFERDKNNKVTVDTTMIIKYSLDSIYGMNAYKNHFFSSWYTGIIFIKTSPYKEWYDNPVSKGSKYYVTKYEKYTFLEFKNGILVNEYSFSHDNYWKTHEEINNKNTSNPEKNLIFYKYNEYLRKIKFKKE